MILGPGETTEYFFHRFLRHHRCVCVCVCQTHIGEIVTAGLDGLDEEATGGGVAVDGTDEVLHRGLMG